MRSQLLFLHCLPPISPVVAKLADTKPNFILVMTDDQSYERSRNS
jgi:hypothetical protein